MGKTKIITLIVLFLAIVSIVFLKISNGKSEIVFTPQNITSVNHNNYTYDNCLDYRYNKFAFLENGFLKSKLIVIDSENKHKYLSGIGASFSIYKDKIVHLNNSDLMITDINTHSRSLIEKNVYNFMLYNDSIIFHTKAFSESESDTEKNTLYFYDFASSKKRVLYKDVSAFRIHKNKLFIITKDYILKEIDLDSLAIKEIMQLDVLAYPIVFMAYKEKVIIQDNTKWFDIIDLNSKEVSQLYMTEKKYNNNRVCFICDDNNFYYSFQATKTDGSIVINIDSENNGLWKVNMETFEKEKVSNETFGELYLFEENLLFGIKNNKLFEIKTTEDKATVRCLDELS